MRAVWVAGLVLVLGCSSATPVPARKAPAVAAPAAPAVPDERDLLWALAPEGAALGVVVSPHGVAMIERAAASAQELLTSSADFAALQADVMHGLMGVLGTPNPTLAGFGLNHDRGFALFVVDDGQIVMVLPVGDRNRFVTALQGSKGADGDVVGSWACQTIDGRYVCAQRRGLFAKLGRGGLDAVRRSAGARGEIEIAGRGGIEPVGRSFAAAAELDRGAVIVRGTVDGVASPVTDLLGAPGRPHADAAGAAGFGVVDLRQVLAALQPQPIASGVTIADLARTLAGPVTYVVGAGTVDPGIRAPLRDPGPARALIEHCDALRLGQFTATVREGACQVSGPGRSLAIDSWIDGGQLRIANRAAGTASAIEPSPLARELAQGAWSVALFGRGHFLDIKDARSQIAMLPAVVASKARLWPLLSEVGVGIRKDGASVHFAIGARTIWSNPDDVVRKLLAISSEDLLSGKGVEIGRSIASGAPSSPFAHDFRAGTAGVLGLGFATGLLAAIAGTAWQDQVKRPYLPSQVQLGGDRAEPPAASFPLVAARAALHTTIFMPPDPTPAPDPPRDMFIKTHYRRGSDSLVAYETPPRPGARRPAILWIAGGFHWGIGATRWRQAPRSNDQTVTALRRGDLVIMFPALRGFSGNPGKPECFLGEVDDILAAAEHLAKRPDVDPARIYLGGHSTGGTLALLAAASTDRFRAVFAFGAVADPRHYGTNGCLPDGKPEAEYAARAPARWMGSIVTPTLVIEGEHGGNTEDFPALHEHASPVVKFAAIPGANHFSVLAPATEAIARAILADTGPRVSITLDTAAITRGVEPPN
jgi:acetyl esterase/lipase